MAIGAAYFVHDEDTIAQGFHRDEVKARNGPAVRPTPIEVRCPIDAVVERTRKVEVGVDQRFDRGTILIDVRLIGPPDHRQCVGMVMRPSGLNGARGLARDVPDPLAFFCYCVCVIELESAGGFDGLLIDELELCDSCAASALAVANSLASSSPSAFLSAKL